MEDNLRLNTKLYEFDGIIGRRDYFLNCIIIASISLLFVLPYQMWLFSNIQEMSDLLSLNKMFLKAPILLKWWVLSGIPLTFILFASNVFRRLNDINGKIKKGLNIFISLLLLLFNFCIILPFQAGCLFWVIGFIIGLLLLFKRGKITSTYPYDFTKEFNWGAYFGTWIWGLVNNSYKTLWMLLLCFTPWSIYFQIYCGLKGNEWAYKNKKWNNVSEFNKSQEKQSTIWAILCFVAVPILYIAIICLLVFIPIFFAADTAKNNPQALENTITKLDNTLNKIGSIYFESQVITQDENSYYVLSSDWNGYTYNQKVKIIDMAANLAANERQKKYKKQYPGSYKSFSKYEELPRTKIYSSETNHLLGEYVISKSVLQTGSFKEIVKAEMNAYKFYNDKTPNEGIQKNRELKKLPTESINNNENNNN